MVSHNCEYFMSWPVWMWGIHTLLAESLKKGTIKPEHVVWLGTNGGYAVCRLGDLPDDDRYDYVEKGRVSEYV